MFVGSRAAAGALVLLFVAFAGVAARETPRHAAAPPPRVATFDGRTAADGVPAFRVTPPGGGGAAAPSLILPSFHGSQPGLLRPDPAVLDGMRLFVPEGDKQPRRNIVMREGAHDFAAHGFTPDQAERLRARLRCGGLGFPDVVEAYVIRRLASSRCRDEIWAARQAGRAWASGPRPPEADREAFLAREAAARRLPVDYAEDADESWLHITSAPPGVYLRSALRQLDDEGLLDRMDAERPRNVAWLNDGALDALYADSRRLFGGTDADWRVYEHHVLTLRNRSMAARLGPMMRRTGGLFVMLGSDHLSGPEGVTDLLRARGFAVEPVRLPLAREQPCPDGRCQERR